MNWRRVACGTVVGIVLILTSARVEARCAGDFDGNNSVTVNELITAVNNALAGCEPPASIVGSFQGQGFETSAGCMDPGDDGTGPLSDITIAITEQTGSSYEGTLTLVPPGEDPFLLDIQGTVDDEGLTKGLGFPPGVPVAAGDFTGRLIGDVLAISVKVGNPTCESDAAIFIGTR